MVDPAAGLEGNGPHQEQSSSVQAVVSDSGPLNLLAQHQHDRLRTVVEKFMGKPPGRAADDDYERASPVHYISAKAPPLMLIYGEADGQVEVAAADEFVVALSRAGAEDVSYLRLGKIDHCPHSLVRVGWLVPAVNEFFLRTLPVR